MPKYIETENAISGQSTTSPFKLDNLDKVNNALDKGMQILDKLIGMKKYKEAETQQIPSTAQTINTKANKVISQMPQPKIIIDDNKAVNLILEVIKNIPKEMKEKPLKDLGEDLNKKETQEFIKPQLNSFVRSCVRLE